MPSRIQLLRKLQVPHALRDIELGPVRPRSGLDPDRHLAVQTVHEHLQKLRDTGLVDAKPVVRDGQALTEFVVNRARLFLVMEEMRQLTLLRPVGMTGDEATAIAGASTRGSPHVPEGSALAVVRGPEEGRIIPLSGEGPWIVGRAPGTQVSLPHDPHASRHNARVRLVRDRHVVEDMEGSLNGVQVNWRTLAPGEQ